LEKGDNITFSVSDTGKGTSVEYLVRRLKRDRPDIAIALGRGEYRSARAAAIAAGIVMAGPDTVRAIATGRKSAVGTSVVALTTATIACVR
jgi:hypothetical protein